MEPSESINYSIISLRQKIIFVGDSGVGKTTLINRINNEEFKDLNESSVGIDYYSKNIKFRGEELTLQIWDTAGQEKYRGLIPTYARNAVLAFIIYDISSKQSFENLTGWIDYLNSIEKMPMIICGNKIDLVDNRQVKKEEGEEFAKKNKLVFFEVSAKTNENINDMFYRSIAELRYFEDYIKDKDKETLTLELKKENGISNNEEISNNKEIVVINKKDNDNNKNNNNNNDKNKNDKKNNKEYELNRIEKKKKSKISSFNERDNYDPLNFSNIKSEKIIHFNKDNSNNSNILIKKKCIC